MSIGWQTGFKWIKSAKKNSSDRARKWLYKTRGSIRVLRIMSTNKKEFIGLQGTSNSYADNNQSVIHLLE